METLKELSFSIITIIELAYDNEEKWKNNENGVMENKFKVIEDSHEIYQYYRKYSNML
ncbi:hypothetical protein [Neobacillus drentensis]|uniref:hypothetical protein n=1 Tax=Neobacillus drentensis TaxID=220684 RepID=UPI002FFF6050